MNAFMEGKSDEGINIAIIGETSNLQRNSKEYADKIEKNENGEIFYHPQIVPYLSALYDQLAFPLIFWNGHGGCGRLNNNEEWSYKHMRRTACSLLMQPNSHWIHKLGYLREEYICSIFGRDLHHRIENAFYRQINLRRESEVKKKSDNPEENEGTTTYIPSSFTNGPAYWKKIGKKVILLSTKYGQPTLFITITCNPGWIENIALDRCSANTNAANIMLIYNERRKTFIKFLKDSKIFGDVNALLWRDEFQQRGYPHTHILLWTTLDTQNVNQLDDVINTQYPKTNDIRQLDKFNDLKILINKYEIHGCTNRCKDKTTGKCTMGFPKEVRDQTEIINGRVHYKRSAEEVKIVPHNLKILTLWRAHHEIEIVTSNDCILYITKYVTKFSDSAEVSLQSQLRFIQKEVEEKDQLHKYGASIITSSCQAFGTLAGYHNYGMFPKVELLNFHLEGDRKIVEKADESEEDLLKRIDDTLSYLLRYFSRPKTEEFRNLAFVEYYERYIVSPNKPAKIEAIQDEGNGTDDKTKRWVYRRTKECVFALQLVPYQNTELFCLRLILEKVPGYSYNDLIMGKESFLKAAESLRLIESGKEAKICLKEGIKNGYFGYILRQMLVNFSIQGINIEKLTLKFQNELMKDLEEKTIDNLYMHLYSEFKYAKAKCIPQFLVNYDHLYKLEQNKEKNQKDLSDLNEQQAFVMKDILKNWDRDQLIFIQGRAGTGKTYFCKELIKELENQKKDVLICGTTGIAACQYENGCTAHSLFGLKCDIEENFDDYSSLIGKDSYKGYLIKKADVIMIDEVSMLTHTIAEKIYFILRFLMSRKDCKGDELKKEPAFGGKKMIFIGDFLQLPPVIPNSKYSLSEKLITKCSWWNMVKMYGLSMPMRCSNKEYNNFLIKVANNEVGDMKWSDLKDITVTDDPKTALDFLLHGVDMRNKIPLKIQWIAATNNLVNKVNEEVEIMKLNSIYDYCQNQANPEEAKKSLDFGKIYAITNIQTEDNKKKSEIRIDKGQLADMVRNWKFADLPNPVVKLLYGMPMSLLRNLNTHDGLVKNKRCWIIGRAGEAAIVEFENGEKAIIPKIKIPKDLSNLIIERKQIPLKTVVAGTIHKSQGLTLDRVVIDFRDKFFEHGMLYVALSRIRDPKNLCILLPEKREDSEIDDIDSIIPIADPEIIELIKKIEQHTKEMMENLSNQNFLSDEENIPNDEYGSDAGNSNQNFLSDEENIPNDEYGSDAGNSNQNFLSDEENIPNDEYGSDAGNSNQNFLSDEENIPNDEYGSDAGNSNQNFLSDEENIPNDEYGSDAGNSNQNFLSDEENIPNDEYGSDAGNSNQNFLSDEENIPNDEYGSDAGNSNQNFLSDEENIPNDEYGSDAGNSNQNFLSDEENIPNDEYGSDAGNSNQNFLSDEENIPNDEYGSDAGNSNQNFLSDEENIPNDEYGSDAGNPNQNFLSDEENIPNDDNGSDAINSNENFISDDENSEIIPNPNFFSKEVVDQLINENKAFRLSSIINTQTVLLNEISLKSIMFGVLYEFWKQKSATKFITPYNIIILKEDDAVQNRMKGSIIIQNHEGNDLDIRYIGPEIFLHICKLNSTSLIWSLGIIFLELVLGDIFEDCYNREIEKNLISYMIKKLSLVLKKFNPDIAQKLKNF
ncbi:hypothetical protein TVAG_172600 [Trichomonas vaginalis G3]|uniref:ATP-dependent DNA helicase n=1 Tax=Trichomonas vaginalis (strain ATCC PRA-98 / G3) TaxID=412133 RepID=A2DF11_TRIV3|nr:hypothetical protein TVAG_172600 [Trichomonas vaginalis G3]|eukprot:XP_001581989.1 hypothetical protein [Trichomonas vaginalis G3]